MPTYDGRVVDGSLNYSSPFFVSSGAKGAFIATWDDTTLRVYSCDDIEAEGELEWALVTNGEFTPGSGFNGKCRIISSREEVDFLFLSWKDQTGVKVARSTASTPSFGAAFAVGSVVTDTAHDHDELGVSVNEELQVVIAPAGSLDSDGLEKYIPYAATSKSGSFTSVSSVPTDYQAILGCVMAVSDTTFYIPMVDLAPPVVPDLETVVFGASGWQDYMITGAGETSIGSTPPAAYNTVNLAGAGLSNGVAVRVDFLADYILNGMTWVADNSGGTLFGKHYYVIARFFDAEGTLIKTIERDSASTFLAELTSDDLQLEQPIREVEIELNLTWASDTGTGTNNVYIDNIAFTAIKVVENTTRKLYKVTLPSTWDDVTPTQVAVPVKPYAMSFDPGAVSNITMLAQDEQGYTRMMFTNSAGSSWNTRRRNVQYTGLKRGGDVLLLWGHNTIGLSDDNGSTIYRRNGSWNVTVGSMDEIRFMMGVI
jgi:hypothetical protein